MIEVRHKHVGGLRVRVMKVTLTEAERDAEENPLFALHFLVSRRLLSD